jgi:acyl carrier protein
MSLPAARTDPLHQLLGTVLGVPPDTIGEDSSPENLPNWDSLAHLTVVLALESEYGLSVPGQDAVMLRSVALIRRYLQDRGVVWP